MKDLLKTTRELLSQLGTEVVSIANEYSDVFSDPTINEQLNRFRLAYEEAIANLDSPTFRIATIGTTSSGKSTIINALIGRKIAPMEADEMSAGILTLSSSNESKMIIEKVEGAIWETGESIGLSDDDIYTYIRDRVMLPYHEKRKLKELPAPQITVLGSLLPVEDPSLLNLPSGVNIEFVDLPGLKSVQDRTNLKVIQQRVNEAFSLVALDYAQIDDKHRMLLLEELKQVVKYLQGRTDSIIFILNRVDLHIEGINLSLEQRIAKLQIEIQNILSLAKPPEIIPFSSLLLYYAQCAWGVTPQTESSQIDPDIRSEFLKGMFANCQIINKRTQGKENRHLNKWFQDIRYKLEDGEYIDDKTMRQILEYALDWSGGKQFWASLRERLEESFPVIVVAPILRRVLESYDVLKKSIVTKGKNLNLQDPDYFKQRCKELNRNIEEVYNGFYQDIEAFIEILKKSDSDTEEELEKEVKNLGVKGFASLSDVIREIEEDLAINIMVIVRDALKNNSPVHEIEDKLLQVINPSLTKELTKAYDVVSRRILSFTKSDGFYTKQVREDDQGSMANLINDEKAVRKLYLSIRYAISARAGFLLQAKSQDIEEAVRSLVDIKINEIIDCCRKFFHEFDIQDEISDSIISIFQQNMSGVPLELPEAIFEFTNPVNTGTTEKNERIGTQEETEYYRSGSCIRETRSRSVTRDVMANITYHEIVFPDFDGMAEQWAEGVMKSKKILWDLLKAWIIDYMNCTKKGFSDSIYKTSSLLNETSEITIKTAQELQLYMQKTNVIFNELESIILSI